MALVATPSVPECSRALLCLLGRHEVSGVGDRPGSGAGVPTLHQAQG
jgi:hypothetical protein